MSHGFVYLFRWGGTNHLDLRCKTCSFILRLSEWNYKEHLTNFMSITSVSILRDQHATSIR